ncbi:DUF3592 domain-containing protein [Actinomadura sp. 1N219]|uniref:DUF3592 domain-containing protein n=1 Tax=Actinomadura sp. 1N219 TaxID=3375152 RepID=UPI0037A34DF0
MAGVIALCVPIIGFSWFFGGVEQMGDASALADRGRPAIGVVQDVRVESQGPGMGVKKDVLVRFSASDGTRHAVWAPGDERVGAAVRVLYDPRDPENASTESVTKQRVGGVTRIGGGAVLSFGLLFAYVVFGWKRLRGLRRTSKADG